MKKILYFLSFIGLLWACDPMEDTYNKLDDSKEPYHGDIAYTLVATDYSNAAAYAKADDSISTWTGYISSFSAFNDSFPGSKYIAKLLPDLFPAYNVGSKASITYNYFAKMPENLTAYANASSYSFVQSDYARVDSLTGITGYLYPDFNPEFYIPAILADSVPNPQKDDIHKVIYKYSDVKPLINVVNNAVVFAEDFETATAYETIDINNWTQYIEAGTATWEGRSFGGNTYASFSAHNTGEPSNIAWLLTPAIDLTEYSAVKLNFKSKDGYNNGDPLEVLISTDYPGTGDPNSYTWTNLNPTLSTGNVSGYASDFTASGDISLNSYCGGVIYIAFKYSGGDGSITTTMQIDDFVVTALTQGYEVVGEQPYIITDYYQYDGTSWAKMDNVHYLTSKDYDAMGDPGDYDNFSSSVLPQDYIPKYLNNLYPTAGEGVSAIVLYKYYTGTSLKTLTIADKLTYTSGEWVSSYNFISTTTAQFIYKPNLGWIFDPTIHLDPSYEDYMLLVNYVYSNLSRTYGSSNYANDEFYYGASAHYLNFDLRLSNKTTYNIPGFDTGTEEEQIALTWSRLQEGLVILLQLKYPDAVTEVNDIPVYYWVTFATYENDLSKNTYTGIFKCTKAGPDPMFERDTTMEDQAVTEGELTSEDVNWNRE
ncbi:MAG: choice-of-anchor J domain-containing protein [Bacteroidales bacterium]|nr:choice-of-anchor J domain-containing protein [Bacteroidales bacterium]HPD94394.1 choice-of-anchor J domain-containing protein [Tenuifilaceae bacterium]HRX30908.1 choice-of-anchor J domain-containing protein [Tenuifilaceae bacterium]